MIARHNFRQTLLALLSACLGVCAFAVAWWFFGFAFAYATHSFGSDLSPLQQSLIAWACVALIAAAGFFHWRKGEGHHHFHESGMMPTAEPHTGLSLEVHTAANRIGAWSYLLGQLVLAGPLQILRAYDRLRLRIPESPVLESELIALRDQLRAKNRWLPLSDWPGRELHVSYLVRLGLVDYSPRKGTLRAR